MAWLTKTVVLLWGVLALLCQIGSAHTQSVLQSPPFSAPPPIGSTTPNTIAATTLSANLFTNFIDRPRSLQSYGATGGPPTTVTISIASPGVVTWTNHGLPAGRKIIFQTTGALPTGITANTTYFVSATGLTANTFQFSATNGGASINTSGTQSGTQTSDTDDADQFTAALAAGLPLECEGTFLVNSLVTVSSQNVVIRGYGDSGCTIILNNPQAMFNFTMITGTYVIVQDIKFSVAAVITSVTGPTHTAAINIAWPSGGGGVNNGPNPSVIIDHVSVIPSQTTSLTDFTCTTQM